MQTAMNGFTLTPDWITEAEEAQLVERLRPLLSEATEKDGGNGRSAVVRFGWDYNDENKWVQDIPEWLNIDHKLNPNVFNSVTVNLYKRGDVIASHIDSLKFGTPIRILSLLSGAIMSFQSPQCRACPVIRERLPVRSLARLDGDYRYKYQHSIAPVKAERISVVFRERLL